MLGTQRNRSSTSTVVAQPLKADMGPWVGGSCIEQLQVQLEGEGQWLSVNVLGWSLHVCLLVGGKQRSASRKLLLVMRASLLYLEDSQPLCSEKQWEQRGFVGHEPQMSANAPVGFGAAERAAERAPEGRPAQIQLEPWEGYLSANFSGSQS